MRIIETRDRELLRGFFRSDPTAHLYQWGDLGEELFSKTRWLIALDNGSPAAVLLLFTGLETPAVLPTGDDRAVEAILDHFALELPMRFYTKVCDPHLPLFTKRFQLDHPLRVQVMALETLTPGTNPSGLRLTLLSVDDLPPLLRIYQHYPGNFFEPAYLESGVYLGAWMETELVAVAGTHAFAPEEGAAVLGNIVTSTRHRGKGFGQAVTGGLVRELLNRGCRDIGLHVETTNEPAIACYQKLGFRRHSIVTQYLATRQA